MIGKKSRKSSPKSRSSAEAFPVLGCWVAENNEIIAYSQHCSDESQNKFFKVHREFVNVFFQQIISPAKPAQIRDSSSPSSSSFTIIYVKKRQYLFHVVYDNDITLIALSSTHTQIALDDIFDLLYAIKSAFLFFENGQSFVPTLEELHTKYNNNLMNKANNKYGDINKNISKNACDIITGPRTIAQQRHSPENLFESIIGDRVISNGNQSNNRTSFLSVLSPNIAAPTFSPHMNGKTYGSMNVIESKGDFFLLKKGFLRKQTGKTINSVKLRYFELWSNGKLNFFENDDKLRKRGCLNICEHVSSCDLCISNNNDNYGFELTTNGRNCVFYLDNQIDRDDWVMIIQTILLTKSEMNLKMKNIKMWLNKLDTKWKNEFASLSFSIENAQLDKCNIFQLQFDLDAAVEVCIKAKQEISYLRGSDIYASLYRKIECLTENMEGAKFTIDAIIQSRDVNSNTNGNQSYKINNNHMKNSKKQRKSNNNNSETKQITIENRIILRSNLNVRLPANGLFRRTGSINKHSEVMEVVIQQKFLKIVIPSLHAPLLWLFNDIVSIKEEKVIYKNSKNHINDAKFGIRVVNENGKQLQFVFSDFDESSLWLAALNTLYEQTHCSKHKSMTQVLKIDIPPPPNVPPPPVKRNHNNNRHNQTIISK